MIVQALGRKFEINPEPMSTYGDFGLFSSKSSDHLFLVSNEGKVLRYENYLGQDLDWMDTLDYSKQDLGDRFVMERYVGGMGYFYRYHICKKTMKPISYFDRVEYEQRENISLYRISAERDFGDTMVVSAFYHKLVRWIRKSDNSDIEIEQPNGEKTSIIKSWYQLTDHLAQIQTGYGTFHFNMKTMKPIIYRDPDTKEVISDFSQTQVKNKPSGSSFWIDRGWRKSQIEPKTAQVIKTRFNWGRVVRYLTFFVCLSLLALGFIGMALRDQLLPS